MKIKEIMTKDLIVVDKNTELFQIAEIMKKYDIGFMPISDNTKIIGVLTDRDIVIRVLANKDGKIDNYYTKNLVSINEDEDIQKAVEIMGKNKIKRLLVEKNNKLVGIISISDIIHKVDGKILIENLKKLWTINRNNDKYKTHIDEFIL